jgi:hypothetical protein
MLAGFAAGLCARGPPFSGPAHEIRLPLRPWCAIGLAWLRRRSSPRRTAQRPPRRQAGCRRTGGGQSGRADPAAAKPATTPATPPRPWPAASAIPAPADPNAPPPAPPPPPLSDIIFTNGDVITLDDKRPAAQAVAVKGTKIIAVGKSKDILARWKSEGTEVVDLAGKTLVPGFVDAWGQMSRLGLYSVAARCSRRRKAA